jgi:hypothetical protein
MHSNRIERFAAFFVAVEIVYYQRRPWANAAIYAKTVGVSLSSEFSLHLAGRE